VVSWVAGENLQDVWSPGFADVVCSVSKFHPTSNVAVPSVKTASKAPSEAAAVVSLKYGYILPSDVKAIEITSWNLGAFAEKACMPAVNNKHEECVWCRAEILGFQNSR